MSEPSPTPAAPPPVLIPAVSGRAYERAMRVKVKIKGEPDGPVYEGQNIILPCPGCPK